MTYNGWKNYETWAVALWIDNEEPHHNRRLEILKNLRDEPLACWGGRAAPIKETYADALENWVDEMMPEIDSGLYSDLLHHAFGKVDWREIAEAWIRDYAECV